MCICCAHTMAHTHTHNAHAADAHAVHTHIHKHDVMTITLLATPIKPGHTKQRVRRGVTESNVLPTGRYSPCAERPTGLILQAREHFCLHARTCMAPSPSPPPSLSLSLSHTPCCFLWQVHRLPPPRDDSMAPARVHRLYLIRRVQSHKPHDLRLDDTTEIDTYVGTLTRQHFRASRARIDR